MPSTHPSRRSPASAAPKPTLTELAIPNLLTVAHYLQPRGIGRLSCCSVSANKAMSDSDIWRDLYLTRFNFDPSQPWNSANAPIPTSPRLPVPPYYKSAYASAHGNKHKLWIQHWNMVLPMDSDGAGRVCVPECGDPRANPVPSFEEVSADGVAPVENPLDIPSDLSNLRKLCPTCRFHPLYEFGARHVHAHYDCEIASDDAIKQDLDNPDSYKSLKFSQYPNGLNQFEVDPVMKSELLASAHSIAVACGDLKSKDATKSGPYHSLNYSAAKATRFLKEKYCVDLKKDRRVNTTLDFYNGVNYKVVKRAERAFVKCATRGRDIDPDQYKASGVHFLNDLIFLLAQPSEQRGNRKFETSNICSLQLYDDRLLATYERNNLALQSCATGTISSLGPKGEIGTHSSHVCKFTNPLFEGIISWKVLCSRRDAFSAYPVEGVLAPGESVSVNFYTRPLGSMMASAIDDVDCLREASTQFARDVFDNEGHLPKVPFQVTYIILPQPPAVPPGYDPFLATEDVNSFCWRMAKPWEIGTINLEGHVNPAYALEDLERYALMPFEDIDHDGLDEYNAYVPRKFKGGFFHAPYLETRRRFARERTQGNQKYNDLDLGASPQERQLGDRECLACKRSWTKRSEELGRNFQLKRLEGIGRGHLRRKEDEQTVAMLKKSAENLESLVSKLKKVKSNRKNMENEEIQKEKARAKRRKAGDQSIEESRWLRAIWHCTHERISMDCLMQSYRSIKNIVDQTSKFRTHPLADMVEQPERDKEILFKLRLGINLLRKIKEEMIDVYGDSVARRINDPQRNLNENWNKLEESKQRKYIGKIDNAKQEYLEPISSPGSIFHSEQEALPKLYQYPRATDFMRHVVTSLKANKEPVLNLEFEKEWEGMVKPLRSMGGHGTGNVYIPMDREGPGTNPRLEINATNLFVAVFLNPAALKGSIYKLAFPGMVRTAVWSNPMFFRKNPKEVMVPGLKGSDEDPKDYESAWAIPLARCFSCLHAGNKNMYIKRVTCEKIASSRLGLADEDEMRSFRVDENYRWKPMPDGEVDKDGYSTLQWGEVVASHDKDFDHSSPTAFWDSFETHNLELKRKGGFGWTLMKDINCRESSVEALSATSPLGIGRMSYDKYKNPFFFTLNVDMYRKKQLMYHKWEGEPGYWFPFRMVTFIVRVCGLFHPSKWSGILSREALMKLTWASLFFSTAPIAISLASRFWGFEPLGPSQLYAAPMPAEVLYYPSRNDCIIMLWFWFYCSVKFGRHARQYCKATTRSVFYKPSPPRKTIISVEELQEGFPFGWMRWIFQWDMSDYVPEHKKTLLKTCDVRGGVLCNDRGELDGWTRIIFFLAFSGASAMCAPTSFAQGFYATSLQSVGLGLSICVDKMQTGTVPDDYDVFTLHHLGAVTTYCLALLFGTGVGTHGGFFFVFDCVIAFISPATAQHMKFRLVSESSYVNVYPIFLFLNFSLTVATRVAVMCNINRGRSTIVGWVVFSISLFCFFMYGVNSLLSSLTFVPRHSLFSFWVERGGRRQERDFQYYNEQGESWQGLRLAA
ncbi:hypothetical protein TrVE_jg5093 [Triparma verrucosa]|uniref:Uncharacterized protein n=1 Tax=Triparma verrucosa TaxID=1606542 RepID=A0A9W7BA50_9STRA|nr:hypothetical protein TrVE_jg5093 [Triparma verrucosa]